MEKLVVNHIYLTLGIAGLVSMIVTGCAIQAGDALYRRFARAQLKRQLGKLTPLTAVCLSCSLLTSQFAYAGSQTAATSTSHPDTFVAKLAVESMHNFNLKMAGKTATPDDLKDVISKAGMFTDYAHLTGVWNDLDARYREAATIEQIKNIALTNETVAQYQQAMERAGVVVSYEQAATHLRNMKLNLPQNIPDLLAMGGTHASMTVMLAHLKTMETNWRLNPAKGPQCTTCGTFKTVNRFVEDPCAFMHLVAASFVVISFFGCIPCGFAAGVAELFGQICDNFL